jgi:hypothetical protein
MTPSPKPEDRLFEGDNVCALCGGRGDRLCDQDGFEGFMYCNGCSARVGSRNPSAADPPRGVYAEYLRRRSLAANPKPAVEKYADFPDDMRELLDEARWAHSSLVDALAENRVYPREDARRMLEPATPPTAPAAESKGRIIYCQDCGLSVPYVDSWIMPGEKPTCRECHWKKSGARGVESNPKKRPDPYANFPHGMNEAQVAIATAGQDLAYRRRVQVDSLLRDMGRPMVRRDKMGREVVPWVGWVSTQHAKGGK